MRIRYRKGSIKWQVLSLIHECGELPYAALRVLGTSNKANQNQVLTMAKDGVIQIEHLYKGKTIKLADTDLSPELSLFRNARRQYEYALPNTYHASGVKTVTNATKERVSRRRRNVRLSKTTAFMFAAGLYVFSDSSIYKPDLLVKGLSGKESAFYLSTDIKKLFSEDEKRIPNRSLGLVVYRGELFPAYFLDHERQMILGSWERKAKRVLEYYLETTSYDREAIERQITKSMILVDQYKLLEDMVLPETFYDKGMKSKHTMRFDETYEKYYCFPYSRNGIKVCGAVLKDRKRLKNLPIKKSNRVEEHESGEYDGKELLFEDHHGKKMLYELSLFDCEMKKLYRFLEFIEFKEYRRRQGEHADEYKIYCLDFQYEMLEDVLRKCKKSAVVKLVSYNTEVVMNKFAERKGAGSKTE